MIKKALPMLSKLFKTDADWAFKILRVVLGIVFFAVCATPVPSGILMSPLP